MKGKKKRKKIPYYILRHNSSKGGKTRNLLDPGHAHRMRQAFKGTRIMPIEYYRNRLIKRLRERFPTLSEATHDFLDRRMIKRWKIPNTGQYQRKYMAKVRAAKGITRADLEVMFKTWKENQRAKKEKDKGKRKNKRSRLREKRK